MSKYYYHGLGEAFYRGDSLNRILKILKTAVRRAEATGKT